MNLTFRQKIVIPVLFLVVTGLFCSGVISHINSKKALQNSFVGKASRAKLSDMFLGWKKSYRYFEDIALANASGEIVASSAKAVIGKIDVSGREYFKSAMARFNLIVALVVTLVASMTVYLMANRLVRPINQVVAGLKDAAEGEGDLANWFNVFVTKVQDIIRDVSDKAGMLNTSSSNLSDIALQMNQAADQTSGQTRSAADSSVEEQSATISEIARNVSQASSGINEVNEKVSHTSDVVGQISGEIEEISQSTGGISGSSAQVTSSAKELSNLSDLLAQLVGRFKV